MHRRTDRRSAGRTGMEEVVVGAERLFGHDQTWIQTKFGQNRLMRRVVTNTNLNSAAKICFCHIANKLALSSENCCSKGIIVHSANTSSEMERERERELTSFVVLLLHSSPFVVFFFDDNDALKSLIIIIQL